METFEILTRALTEHRVLKFRYRKLDTRVIQTRVVRPYHLGCINNHWYLFSYDLRRKGLRTFALPRLTSPELMPQTFTPPRPEEFDINDYLHDCFTVFKGTHDYDVVVDFDSWGADLVHGRKWHPSQESMDLPGHGLRLRFRLASLEEIEGWVLSWGKHATVVRPEALVRRVREVVGALQNRYNNAPKARQAEQSSLNISP